jgi:hypothetical protein
MIRKAFAVVLSWMRVIIKCPVLQVSLPEVCNKTAEINGLTVFAASVCRDTIG